MDATNWMTQTGSTFRPHWMVALGIKVAFRLNGHESDNPI